MFTRATANDHPGSPTSALRTLIRKPAFLKVTKPADTHFCAVSPDLQIAVENTITEMGFG